MAIGTLPRSAGFEVSGAATIQIAGDASRGASCRQCAGSYEAAYRKPDERARASVLHVVRSKAPQKMDFSP